MHSTPSWRRSRYGLAAFWFGSLMAGWLVLRLVLFFAFRPSHLSLSEVVLAFLSGLGRDALAGLWLSLPLLFWLWAVPERWFRATWHRRLFWTLCALFWSAQIFQWFAEYYFFEEFRSRFNTVAVDYLIYPQEVFINIWESYPVALVVGICLALGSGWAIAAWGLFRGLWESPPASRAAWERFAAVGALAGALTPLVLVAGALTGVLSPRLPLKSANISPNRTLNEMADNGVLTFFLAAVTHNLDYAAFYQTMPLDQAYARMRHLLTEPNTQFVDGGNSLRRRVAGDPSRPRLNVVLFLEESLGSEFWGSLGRKHTLTPEMDRVATQESLFFTNIYACGNRTVRGMEGVLSSFPPLPGDSIVKRDLSDNVETIARILKRDGYSTLFLYGGRGVFDGMRSFTLRNGYDRFIEQKHFEHPTFTTAWGVCDEDIYSRTIEECRELVKAKQPFFATILSVSNHKPYTFPKGRIPENPDKHRREYAVKYADYALGKFFREVRQEAFWTNTIFVVVADHGARAYGKQTIPIHTYEIPLVITGPAVVHAPVRIPRLGSSLDVSPTILGLLGRPYETLFFGHDLLGCPPDHDHAVLNHNRDIGLLARDRMVVLGLMKTVEFYQGDPKRVEMSPLPEPSESDRDLEQDAIAIYQVADDLYTRRRYHIDER